jgi:hypothetical protein
MNPAFQCQQQYRTGKSPHKAKRKLVAGWNGAVLYVKEEAGSRL